MPITKPPVKNIWADTGDKTEPTAGEVLTGWPLSSTPPSRQRFNWILNFCANAVRYFSRRGLVDWDAAETYSIGDRVIGDDGYSYRCIQNANINNLPSTATTWWELWPYVGQWTNMIGSRVLGTTYTNTNRFPLHVSVTVTSINTPNTSLVATIDGVAIIQGGPVPATGVGTGIYFVVPPAKTYSVQASAGVGTLSTWRELK